MTDSMRNTVRSPIPSSIDFEGGGIGGEGGTGFEKIERRGGLQSV